MRVLLLRFAFILALLLGIVLALAACGDDDDDDNGGAAGDDDDDNDDESPADDDTSPTDDDDDDDTAPPTYEWQIETVIEAGFFCPSSTWGPVRCHATAIGPDNQPVIAFYDATKLDICAAIRTAKGWTVETIEEDADVGLDPSVAVDSTGRIAVAYFKSTTKEVKVAFKSPGGSWDIYSMGVVGGLQGIGGWPNIRFDANDRANIVTYRFMMLSILYIRETGAGEFDQQVPWGSSVIYEKSPAFEFDSQGRVGAVWQNEEDDYATRKFYYGLWDFTNNAQKTTVTQMAADTSKDYFAFAFDAADTPHVFFTQGEPLQLVMATTTTGTDWDMEAVPDESDQLNGPIEAGHSADGTVWLAYSSDFPLTPRVAKLADGEWTLYDVVDNDEGEYGKNPALAIGPDGLPGVAYMYMPDYVNGQLKFARMVEVDAK
jgi:hypothetical protein